MSRSIRICIALALGVGTSMASAGTFIDFNANQNRVVHGGNYSGTGGEIQVSVCLDPGALPLSGDPTQAIRNALAAFNQLTPIVGNIANNPNAGSDFESVLLHEVGHCIGMDHSALGPSETNSSAALNFHANAFRGGNGAFDVNAGADGVRGSRDDIRGDDINRNWFRKNTNNPFEIPPATVDRNTYSTSLADLPGGHSFVENSTSFGPCNGGQPNTSGLRGVAPTQNTMFPVICSNNVIRRLAPDDVATLRIARAGRDGVQGTADDYTLRLNYIGQSNNCDIKIRFTNTAGFAFCGTSASGAPNGDFAVTSATAEFQNTVNWFYNQVATDGNANIGPTVSASTPANNSTTALGGGAVGGLVNGSITFGVAGGSGTGTTSLACTVGSGTAIITSNAMQSIAVGATANAVGVRFTLTNNPQNGVINCTATPQGGQVANFSYTFTANAGAGDTPVGPTVSANTPANNSSTPLGGGNVGDLVNGSITFGVTGGSGAGTTSLNCTVGSGTAVITSNAMQSIAVGATAGAVGVRFTLNANPQNGVINCTATPQGGQVANFSYTFTANAGTVAPPDGLCAVVGQTIPDNNAQGLSNTLPVAQLGNIIGLDVLIDIDHTYAGDLVVDLMHASSATTVRLVNRPGGGGCSGNDIKVTLDDQATPSIQTNCQEGQSAFPEQRYRPANALSAFNGRSLNGNWTLRVFDNAAADTGQLVRWCLLPTTGGNADTIFINGFE